MRGSRHQPTPDSRSKVESLAACGVPEDLIARIVEIDPKTLRKHYREELDLGHVKANASVAGSLYRKALGDGPQAVAAGIFWMKTRAGWRETPQAVTLGSDKDKPLTIEHKTDESFEQLVGALDSVLRSSTGSDSGED